MTAAVAKFPKGIEELSAISPIPEEIPHDLASRVMARYLNQDGLLIQSFSPEAKDNPYLAEIAIRNNPNSIQFFSDAIKDNPRLVHLACSLNGFTYLMASERLKLDESIFNLAFETIIENDPSELFHFVCLAVADIPSVYRFLNNVLDDDTDLALLAIKHDPFQLINVSDRLKKDPYVLSQASEVFEVMPRESVEAFLENFSQYSLCFSNFLSDSFKSDAEFLEKCILKYLNHHSEFEVEFLAHAKNDSVLTEAICQFLPDFFQHLDVAVKSNEAYAVHMIKTVHSRIFEFLDPALQANPNVVRIACEEEGGNLFYAKGDFASRLDIVEIACQNEPCAYFFATIDVQRNIPLAATVLKEFKHEFIKRIPQALADDREFWNAIVALDPSLRDYLPA